MQLNNENNWYIFDNFEQNISKASSIQEILLAEGRYTKSIYQMCATNSKIKFNRDRRLVKEDPVNPLLTHSNYLCYGYASVVLTGLGIPYSLPIMHGKTRRGALVFDVADLIKDAISIPLSFFHGLNSNISDSEFRKIVTNTSERYGLLDRMFKDVVSLVEDEHV